VTVNYLGFIEDQDEPVELTFDVNVRADKYDAYGNWPIFDYTGKAITSKTFASKLVMYDSADEKIPADAYTFTVGKASKQGWYTAEVKFKDTEKYPESVTIDYGIGPKRPSARSLTAGKKKLTVRWKKFSKSQLKKIDGMYIELATDKNFTQNFKVVKVSKKTLKKGYKSIKKLKGGKKYYVRMYTYKKIKQGGENFYMYSDYSKTKVRKTRK
jgi:co-chaperonin GroES (HSP10)